MMLVQLGELVTLDFSPSAGHEPAKRRPAVVVSTDIYNAYSSLIFVCPITSVDNGYPMHVPLPSGSSVRGWICAEQLSGVDATARRMAPLGEQLDESTMGEVLALIQSIFGL